MNYIFQINFLHIFIIYFFIFCTFLSKNFIDKNENTTGKKTKGFMKKINDNMTMLNGSKIFAGIMIIVLQIS